MCVCVRVRVCVCTCVCVCTPMFQLDGYLTTYKIVSHDVLGTILNSGDESAPFHALVLMTSQASSLTILRSIWNISISCTRQDVSHCQAFTQCCSSCLRLPPLLPG